MTENQSIATQSLKGEEIRNRTSVNRIRTHRRTNSIILFFVIGLLFVSTDAPAQLKKSDCARPACDRGSCTPMSQKWRKQN